MKKSISLEARKEILAKITKAYEGYDEIIYDIVKNGILYYSNNGDCVAWVHDTNTFLDFLNLGVINTDYYVYKFALLDGELVTIKAE